MERLKVKWYPEPAPAAPTQIKPRQFGVVYWKKVKDVKGIGGKIVMRVCGETKEEAEQLALHVCNLHNQLLK